MIYDSHGILSWIFYFFFTVIINIVMLNLLIQLISDSYTECQANGKSTESRAMIKMLFEVGSLRRLHKKYTQKNSAQEEENTYFVHRFVTFRGRGVFIDDSSSL